MDINVNLDDARGMDISQNLPETAAGLRHRQIYLVEFSRVLFCLKVK